jgi:phage portal protein BeeE
MRIPFLKRADPALSFQQWVEFMSYGGVGYGLSPTTTWAGAKQERPDGTFSSYIQSIYGSNSVIYSCMVVRMRLFSEARFQFRQILNGRPGELFGTKELQILETPWVNGTTGDMLMRMIQDADLAGNSYHYRAGDRLVRMRPDWVNVVLGSRQLPDHPGWALDAEVVGYVYQPGGLKTGEEPIMLLPEQVAHFALTPDPSARFRGMSWLTPVIREVMADQSMTDHRLKFFEQGATVNLAVKFSETQPALFKEMVAAFKEEHQGVARAYKTLFLGGGMDAVPVGTNLKDMDFKSTQGAGETRIAAAAEVPPVIVGLSEGLQAATYSNYGLAMRRFVDLTMRPLWRNAAASLATLVKIPGNAELWYDDRDIPALHESSRDAAEIMQINMQSIHNGIIGGFDPASVVDAVASGELSRLQHSGMLSVQLLPIGKVGEGKGSLVEGVPEPSTNGSSTP